MRSSSPAYPSHSSLWSRCIICVRYNARAVAATAAFLCFIFVLSSDIVQDSTVGNDGPSHSHLRIRTSAGSDDDGTYQFGGAFYPGYFSAEDSVVKDGLFRFVAVTDLDQLSKRENSMSWKSMLQPGLLERDGSRYRIKTLETARELVSKHNEGGRGMELSELVIFRNRLLTFDDRTGIVFEILTGEDQRSVVAPRFILSEGDGDTDKGMKWEWATVKDDELYMGSMGKEYTNPDGSVANTNNLWIVVMNKKGQVRRVDWTSEYTAVRKALGAASPGYIIHEAISWSSHLNKWVFLPRRVSTAAYDEIEDEKMGSNKLVLIDEDFQDPKVVEIQLSRTDPYRGFSTFAFIPGTNDRHALAVRSVEENCVGGDEHECKQRSYLVVFDVLTGEVLMDETELSHNVKYEGIEFVDIHSRPPPNSQS